MHSKFTESSYEEAVITIFQNQGYSYTCGYDVHRQKKEIILTEDFFNFISNNYANENFTKNDLEKILHELNYISSANLHTSFKKTLSLIRNGFILKKENGISVHFDFINFLVASNNIFRVVNQYEVRGVEETRRPDIVVFVNGIPVSVIELKNPKDSNVSVKDAYEDVKNKCCRGIPDLMRYCFVSMISDFANTLVGTIFSDYEFFSPWRSSNGNDYYKDPQGILNATINGMYSFSVLLNLIKNYIFVPDNSADSENAILPKYYQYYHTEFLYEHIKKSLKFNGGNGKGGTYFGSTGSGKSYIMLFLTRKLTQDVELFNPTVLLITDRTDLDDQLSETFVNSKDYLNDKNIYSFESRNELNNKLRDIASGGVYLMTVQKFSENTNMLSNRENIICISDEAHRSQTNLETSYSLDNALGIKKIVGFAKYLRSSLPNATYVGFTGTPIEDTLKVFGDVVCSYQMKRAQEDGAIVGLEYIPGPDMVKLDEEKIKIVENYYQKCEEDGTNKYQIEQSKRDTSSVRTIVGNPKRIKNIALHFVALYEKRVEEGATICGKAMFVCYDREIAYKFYNELKLLRPDWFVKKNRDDTYQTSVEDDCKLLPLEKVILVATRDTNDPKDLFDLLGTKEYRNRLAAEFKKKESNFKIAILVDMWITGFDVPCLDTMYIDKPLHKHLLIQTISRVNRIFKDKKRGIIIDYIGLKTSLAKAIKQYGGDMPSIGTDVSISIDIFKDTFKIIKDMFNSLDLSSFFSRDPLVQLGAINDAAEFIMQEKELENKFMNKVKILKSSLDICVGTFEISDSDITLTHLFFIIQSII